eukprot:4087230-Amphidinium_carterae.1
MHGSPSERSSGTGRSGQRMGQMWSLPGGPLAPKTERCCNLSDQKAHTMILADCSPPLFALR